MGKRVSDSEALVVVQAIGLEPLEPYPGAVGQPWRCRCTSCGRESSPRINNIKAGRTTRCRHCANERSAAHRRTPQAEAEHAMREAGLDPLGPYPGNLRTPWPAVCVACGKLVDPQLGSIKSGRSGCRFCAGRAVDPADAERMMRAAGYEPLEDFPGTAVPWKCTCSECGRASEPRYSNVVLNGTSCKYCAGRAVDEADAVRIMEAADLVPLEPFPGTQVPWRCRCSKCDREVQPRYGGVVAGQGGCRWCAPNAPVDVEQAAVVMATAGLEVLSPYPGYHVPWLALCTTCGREVAPTYAHIASGERGGCVYCAGNAVDEADAVELMLAAGLEPLDPYPGARTPWRCRCGGCGAEVSPRWNSVQQGQGGCRACATSGFDPSCPGAIYLMWHQGLRAWQIGISNQPVKRVASHRRQGWDLVELIEMDDGYKAASIERAILRAWRRAGYRPAASREQLPQGGYTETVSAEDVAECSLTELILEHAED
jgi:hypothetical protein